MTKKTLYIHIGTHKAGSTAIQSVFEKNSHKIVEQTGVQYIPFPNKEKGVKGSLSNALITLAEDVVETEFSPKIFVSSEAFCGQFVDIGEHDLFVGQFYQIAGQIATMIHDTLSPLPVDIKVIICVRRQDDFLESAYKQTIQAGDHQSIDDYLATMELGEDFRWDHLAGAYADIFGEENISIINYDVATKTEGLLSSFGEILGSEIASMSAPRSNVSYSARAVEFAKDVNPYLDDLQKKKLRFFLQREVFQEKGGPQILTPTKRAEIYDLYKPSNRILAERFNIVQDTPDGLFQPFSGSPTTGLNETSNVMLAKSMVINREALEAHSRLKKVVDEQALEIMDLRAEIKAIMRQINDS